jgi:hypothetical protein
MEDHIKQGWRKSSYSGNGGGDCIEVAHVHDGIAVRDTKDRTGPVLRFAPAVWRRFAGQVKRSLAAEPYRMAVGAPP